MNYCPISYQALTQDENTYSEAGLHQLNPKLTKLVPLDFTAEDLRFEATMRADKMSIQGVQPKLSAKLRIKEGKFDIVDNHGRYILKPPSFFYPELPQNEAITMSMAALCGIEVPIHGLLYGKDGQMTYFIKRFDRRARGIRVAVEDFSQLSQLGRDAKYKSSMEKVADIILAKGFCTFPLLEAKKLFMRVLFCYVTGNEDMHLKNFSLITSDNKITLAPAYDLLNTTIAQKNTKEEFALPLSGKKNNITKKNLITEFGQKKLLLNEKVIDEILNQFHQAIPKWQDLLKRSFLSNMMQEKYSELLQSRAKKMGLL
jgi:serine/threonine-protein kinase HipA